MRFSCLPVSLYPALSAGETTLAAWFGLAAELGLDGADISVAHLDSLASWWLDVLRRQAEEAGIVIAGMVTYTDFTHPNPAERQRHQQELRTYIDVAARLGVDFLRVTAGQNHPGVGLAEGIAWAVDGLTRWVAEANAAGITLTYENHAIGYGWTYYDFSQRAEIFLEICTRCADSGLQILFDTANLLAVNDDPLLVLESITTTEATIEQLACRGQDHVEGGVAKLPRLAAVHASDIRQMGTFEPVILGTGVAPLEEIFRHLQAIGFDGWISVEEASKQAQGLQRAIPYAQDLWQMVLTDSRCYG